MGMTTGVLPSPADPLYQRLPCWFVTAYTQRSVLSYFGRFCTSRCYTTMLPILHRFRTQGCLMAIVPDCFFARGSPTGDQFSISDESDQHCISGARCTSSVYRG